MVYTFDFKEYSGCLLSLFFFMFLSLTNHKPPSRLLANSLILEEDLAQLDDCDIHLVHKTFANPGPFIYSVLLIPPTLSPTLSPKFTPHNGGPKSFSDKASGNGLVVMFIP